MSLDLEKFAQRCMEIHDLETLEYRLASAYLNGHKYVTRAEYDRLALRYREADKLIFKVLNLLEEENPAIVNGTVTADSIQLAAIRKDRLENIIKAKRLLTEWVYR